MNGFPRHDIHQGVRSEFVAVAAVLTFGLGGLGLTAAEPKREAALDFNRDIRPILAENCYRCHGPDEKHREASLRLDSAEGLRTPGDSGLAVVVPGQPAKSELVTRIRSTEAGLQMPPHTSGKKLTPRQIDMLAAWVSQGAKFSNHWAFTAPQTGTVPTPKQSAWVRNPLDAFILDRLEREGLNPSTETDRITWLRRLSLDLIGLPPTPAEVDAFVADQSPDAYATQVDRLLASPHYGERWARLWLDAARYADSDGFEKDKPRFVWAYRDYVIQSFNRNLPYDRFIIEQIAGDLLPNATQDQIVATGFLRNSMINEEGGIDPEQFRMEAMFDRMDAIGKAMLGLTIQCAQCHNHKYDPLTQQEYYRLFAFLNNSHEANVPVYSPDALRSRAKLFDEIRQHEMTLREKHPDWRERLTRWEADVKGNQPEWQVLHLDYDPSGGQKLYPQPDGSILAAGYAPTKHTVTLSLKSTSSRIAAIRLELLTDPSLPLMGPGRSITGTAALTEFEVQAAPLGDPKKSARIPIATASSDCEIAEAPLEKMYDDNTKRSRVLGPVAYAIDGKDETAWSSDAGAGRRNQARKAVFVFKSAIEHEGGTQLTIHLKQNHGGANSDQNQNLNLGRIRISVTAADNVVADPLPARVRELLAIPAAERTPRQVDALFSAFRETVAEWKETNAAIERLWRSHPEGTSQLALMEREELRPTHLLERGDFLKPKQIVEPGVPAFLHALTRSPSDSSSPHLTRLDLARWLADRASPTTARSFVNRVWQAYFGTGLVRTSDDLGLQGEPATHPELLDWLAADFVENGWNVKRLHRQIVLSSTHRQRSVTTPDLQNRDAENRLLARGPRFRVEAETVRDILLQASGLLNRKVGGRSVYPPAPDFLFKPPASYGPKLWETEPDAERYRRAMYTFRYRSVPYPMLQAFDAPNADVSCVRRSRSNTPLQALVTLNEPLSLECAQALAAETLAHGGADDAARLAFAFRRCVSRAPSPDEQRMLLGMLSRQQTKLAAHPAQALELLREADRDRLQKQSPQSATSLAAWTTIARVLLNLDETISKE